MTKSPSIAKITRLRSLDVLPRTRLFHLLDRGNKQTPVIWVSGPAGSGKTTLVSSYLDVRKLPCLWYQMDEGDADLATFFYYMGLAGKKAAPRHKRPLPLLTAEYGLGIPTFTRRFFENLCSRLRPPYVLVFDNYQEIPPDSMFHEIMRTGLSTLPENIIAIIISRTEPLAVFSGMLAGNKLQAITWDDVRFTVEESKGLIRLQQAGRIQPLLIEELHEKANGWAAGLVLLTRVAKSEGMKPEALKEVAPDQVFNYFANELFDRLDVSTQDFLVKTALAPRLTPELAEEMTGNKAAGRILAELNRNNYFTEKRIHSDTIYQYHALFRDFLMIQAAHRFRPEELSELKLKAATHLEATGNIADAAELFIQARAWKELSGLVIRHALPFIMQGRYKTVEKWVEAIPSEITIESAWLLYWLGICQFPIMPDESQRHLKRAIALFEADGDTTGVLLAWSSLVETTIHAFDNITELDEWMEFIDSYLKKTKAVVPGQLGNRLAGAMIHAMVMRRPDHPDFEVWLKRVGPHDDPHQHMSVLLALSYFRGYKGERAKAEVIINSMRGISRTRDISPLEQIMVKLAETLWFAFLGDAEKCSQSCSEGLQISENTGVRLFDFQLMGSAIAAAFDSNRRDLVAGYVEKMGVAAERLRGNDRSFYHYLIAMQAFMEKDLPKADYHIRTALELASHAGFIMSELLSRLVYIQVLIDRGKYGDTDEHLAKVSDFGQAFDSHLLRYDVMLLRAHKAFRMTREMEGLGFLRDGLAIARENRIFSTYFAWRPSDIAELCSMALQHGIEVEYVQELIRRKNIVPERPPLHLENWPWQVKIATLGEFKINVNGKPVQFSGKVQKKPLELLKVIISLGGREVSEETIIDELWPDAVGDLAHKSFEMALQRLRKLLENDQAVRRQDGTLSLDDRYCWTDAWAFEKIQIDGARGRTEIGEERALLEKAINQYKGHFLPADATQPWTTLPRERLRSKYLRLITRAGEQYEQSGEWKKAVDCFELGLERDPVCEEFYQHLMICHDKLGHRSEAVKAYQRCSAALREGLSLEPSPKTEELYSKLL